MTSRRYAILRVGDFWRIVGGRRQAEDFPTRDAVALATARLAAQAIQDGFQVELVISAPLNAALPEAERLVPGAGPKAEEAAAHTRYRQNSGEFAMAVDRAAERADAPRSFQQVWTQRV